MPREDDPRVVVRMTPAGYAAVEAAAESVNVSVGGLMRECSERYAAAVAREIAAGHLVLRRRKVEKAVKAVRGQVAPASTLIAGPSERDRNMAEHQAKLNADREKRPRPRAVRRQVP